MGLSEKECLKQASIILKKLAVRQACITAVSGQNMLGSDREYQVVLADSGQVRKIFTAPVFQKLCSLDWIMASGRCYILSPVGKSALRRGLSGGCDFVSQHQSHRNEARVVDGEKQTVKVSGSESPLAWLARRKDARGQPMISEEELRAGLRLEQDFYFAGLSPNITANWSPTGGAGGKALKHGMRNGAQAPDHIMAAKDRIRKVVDHLGGQMAMVALDVCCFHLGLEQLERSRNWPKRSGKVVLQLSLQRLAEYYGLTNSENEVWSRYRPLSGWGAEGYRPKFQE